MSAEYRLGDRFLVEGIESIVLYVNHGDAWLGPIKDSALGVTHKGASLRVGLVFTKLNRLYKTPEGKRAYPIDADENGAV